MIKRADYDEVTYYTSDDPGAAGYCIEINRRSTPSGRNESPGAWTLVLGDMAYHEIPRGMQAMIHDETDAREIAKLLNETGYDEDAIGALIWGTKQGES